MNSGPEETIASVNSFAAIQNVLSNAMLAPFTTIGIGGPSDRLAHVESIAELRELLRAATHDTVPIFILGGGSNVLVSDSGFRGLTIKMEILGIDIENTDSETPLIIAGAGIEWDYLVEFAVDRELQGIECLSGIPGCVGASPIQNIGAYGQEACETIEWVEVMDRESQILSAIPGAECGFGYRQSRFKGIDKNSYVVTRVAFRLRRGARPVIRYADLIRYFELEGADNPTLLQTRQAVIAIRRRKAMVIDPADVDSRSCGSFFMNPIVDNETFARIEELAAKDLLKPGEKMPGYAAGPGHVKLSAAWLMERSGLKKGTGHGNAALSTKHILAITNRGHATSADVLTLVKLVQESVQDKFGITLEPEPEMIR